MSAPIRKATLKREWQMAWRNVSDVINPVAFFLIVITLVPLGIGANKTQLAAIAPGMLWVAALLACLLSADLLFRREFDDGTLEQYLLLPHALYGILWIKIAVHWLFFGLPLVLVSPLLGLMLSLPSSALLVLMLALCLGTMSLSLIGAMGAALTVGLRRGGLLLAVIALPLYIPVLIFGASATAQAADGFFPAGQLMLLAALVLFTLGFAPLVVIAGLKIGIES